MPENSELGEGSVVDLLIAATGPESAQAAAVAAAAEAIAAAAAVEVAAEAAETAAAAVTVASAAAAKAAAKANRVAAQAALAAAAAATETATYATQELSAQTVITEGATAGTHRAAAEVAASAQATVNAAAAAAALAVAKIAVAVAESAAVAAKAAIDAATLVEVELGRSVAATAVSLTRVDLSVRVESQPDADRRRDRAIDRFGSELPPATGGMRRDEAGEKRDRAAEKRDDLGDERDGAGEGRDESATLRDDAGDERDDIGERRDRSAQQRDEVGHHRSDSGNQRDQAAALRDDASQTRDEAARRRDNAATLRDEAAQRFDADQDHTTVDVVRQAGVDRREAAEDRRQAREDRHAGADERSYAGHDRRTSLADREAGTSERRHAGHDRSTALADREAGADERNWARQDRNIALADREAGAGERSSAGQDRETAVADRDAGALDRTAARIERSSIEQGIRSRAGWAMDNERRYERRRSFSEALQRSLLTAPPQFERFDTAVRYVPASSEEEVGGDWYDAFVAESGAAVIAIGDVMGHDIGAAVAMGQVRGLLRGIGFTTSDGPAALLVRLEAAMEGLEVDTSATAIVARLEQDDSVSGHGKVWLRWSNAGHPPAIIVTSDGHAQILNGEQNLMLGVNPSSARHENVVPLAEGDTVVLYTDGLVEHRHSDFDEGVSRLMAVLADVASLPLERLCDELLARLVPENHEDDVALLAVRLHT